MDKELRQLFALAIRKGLNLQIEYANIDDLPVFRLSADRKTLRGEMLFLS
jgi:hypothetical protein